MTTYDREVIEAAHHAAPIFADNGWTYGSPDEQHIPDRWELAAAVQRLVNAVREADVELDDNGYGSSSRQSGRWEIRREIHPYAFDPPDDEVTIMLQLGTIEAPK